MQEGKLDGVFLAAFIGQGKRDEASLQEAVQKVTGLIEGIRKQAELNKDLCGIAVTNQDFIRLKNEGKKAFFIGIENGYGIGRIWRISLSSRRWVSIISRSATPTITIFATHPPIPRKNGTV